MLRFESSNQLGNRMTAEPFELGGIAMPPGTPVTLCIGAANRDPAQFADPERFDIGRTPNRHLAFGTGAHQCAGMALARLEGAIAISRFLARFPDYALAGEPVRGGRVRFRGFLSVPCMSARPWTNCRGPASQDRNPKCRRLANDFYACALTFPGGEAQRSEFHGSAIRPHSSVISWRYRHHDEHRIAGSRARRTCAAP